MLKVACLLCINSVVDVLIVLDYWNILTYQHRTSLVKFNHISKHRHMHWLHHLIRISFPWQPKKRRKIKEQVWWWMVAVYCMCICKFWICWLVSVTSTQRTVLAFITLSSNNSGGSKMISVHVILSGLKDSWGDQPVPLWWTGPLFRGSIVWVIALQACDIHSFNKNF